MPRGFEGVRRASKEIAKKRAASGGMAGLWFKIADGETAIVRFLEQDDDIAWADVHDIPVTGRKWGQKVPCLNQENDGTYCPACNSPDEDIAKTTYLGYVNVIWRDAPVYKRDKENKLVKVDGDYVVTGHKDQVAIWSSGVRLFEMLDEKNAKYKGLSSRDFEVQRKGTGFDTKYILEPEDVDGGRQEMSKADKKLAEDKNDFSKIIEPPTEDEMLEKMGVVPSGKENAKRVEKAQSSNPFKRNRK